MATRTWSVAEAKAKLSDLIHRAEADGPQTITRKGHAAAVVVSIEEWHERTGRNGTLADFFASSPLRGSGARFRRFKGGARKVEL
jgi:prevent-host-death family protein